MIKIASLLTLSPVVLVCALYAAPVSFVGCIRLAAVTASR